MKLQLVNKLLSSCTQIKLSLFCSKIMTISATTAANNCNRMQFNKCLRRQMQQFCLKFVIAFICCTSLCLICYLVETNNQLVFEVEHSSEKLVQSEPIHGRGYRHHEPWPTRVALNQRSVVSVEEENDESADVEKLIDAVSTDEGSGLGSALNHNNNNYDNNDEAMLPSEVADSLEELYSTIADENLNMWTDGSSVAPTTTTTKIISQKEQNEYLEQYIMEHKAQTIDTSDEQITKSPTITTTTAEPMEKTTMSPAKNVDWTTSRPLLDDKEEVAFVVTPILGRETAMEEPKNAKPLFETEQADIVASPPQSFETEQADIVATPPQFLDKVYTQRSADKQLVEKLPFDSELWFNDDEISESLERLLLKSEVEDDQALASLYNAEEPAFFPEDYSFPEVKQEQAMPPTNNFGQEEQQQLPWPYTGQEEYNEGNGEESPEDDQHLPQFIDQLVGHLGKISTYLTPRPPTYHKIPGAIYPTTFHNHLNNFRDALADEHQQLASASVFKSHLLPQPQIKLPEALTKFKRKTATMPWQAGADYMDPVLGMWLNEQPKELKDAVTIFNILFPRH